MSYGKIYFSTIYATGRVDKEWCFCYSHKRGESSSIVVWDIGSAMNLESLLKANGYKETSRAEYNAAVVGHAEATG